MAGLLHKLRDRFSKMIGSRFISRYLILLVDVIVGVFAGLVSLWGFSHLSHLIDATGTLYLQFGIAAMIAILIASVAFQTHRQLLRYQVFALSMRVLLMMALNWAIFLIVLILENALAGNIYDIKVLTLSSFSYIVIFFVIYSIYRAFLITLARWLRVGDLGEKQPKERVLIYGVNDESAKIASQLIKSDKFSIVGFCQKDKPIGKALLDGKPILVANTKEELDKIVKKHRIDSIIFSSKSDFLKEREHFIYACAAMGVKTYLAPDINETTPTAVARESVQNIQMEDLLQRPVIKHEENKVKEMYRNKVVMVTGAAGSIGSELAMQIAELGVKQLILFDIAETPLHEIRLKIQNRFPKLDFVPVLGDIRSRNRLDAIFGKYKPEIVLHAAAYKHVPLLEENPCEAALVNVEGSKNIADFCLKHDVERMVMISTDKAVNPTNVLGASKRAAEIYVQALGKAIEDGKVEGKTKYITTRFGNVLGSQGSVINLFRDQIAKGGPVTVTDERIVRYFMSIREACSLVLEASSIATQTQIFVFDMGEEHKIVNLAENMIRLAGLEPYKDIPIVFSGLRPGEKLYEEKLADGENTISTNIPKIHIARVREYDYASLCDTYEQLREHARHVDIVPCVQILKDLVPEYISAENSPFAPLDK